MKEKIIVRFNELKEMLNESSFNQSTVKMILNSEFKNSKKIIDEIVNENLESKRNKIDSDDVMQQIIDLIKDHGQFNKKFIIENFDYEGMNIKSSTLNHILSFWKFIESYHRLMND